MKVGVHPHSASAMFPDISTSKISHFAGDVKLRDEDSA